MDAWEELALTVPGTLMLFGTGAMEAVKSIEAAHRKLEAYVALTRTIRERMIREGPAGATDAMENFEDPPPVGVLPGKILEYARREISSVASRHAMSGHVFVRYAAHHGIQHDPPCSSWDVHYRDAIRLTDDALGRVRNAATHAAAAVDAVKSAGLIANDIRQWNDWMLAAVDLGNRAVTNASQALVEVHDARHAVALEFFDAWKIVRRGRSLSAERNNRRELALTVPATLILIATETESSRLINVARSKLDSRVGLLRSIRQGTPTNDALKNFVDPDPEGVLPTVILEDARDEITRNAQEQATIHDIFASYAAFLGIQDEPPYTRWFASHQEAVGHTNNALYLLGTAVLDFEEARGAVGTMGNLPYYCPLWEEWALNGQNLTRLADLEANLALNAMIRARQAICEEFFDAWAILRR
uniref:Uncharacterized protein n=1 Tax=Leersia perrieri TaxID=77586 RepID=A0A0D9UWY6_9ORYZ